MMNWNATLARYLAKENLIDDVDIVDVGCSGGIDPNLRQLEPKLAGMCIDPLVKEIRRLQEIETNPKLVYVNSYVISDRTYETNPQPDTEANWFYRSSAVAALDPGTDMVGKLIGSKSK